MNITPDQLKYAADASAQLTTWALSMGGASVLALASGSYRRPPKLVWRLPYLFFVPGWAFLAASVYAGSQISGAYVAARLVSKPDLIQQIALNINTHFIDQQFHFSASLYCFGLWLLIYVVLWIFFDIVDKEKAK